MNAIAVVRKRLYLQLFWQFANDVVAFLTQSLYLSGFLKLLHALMSFLLPQEQQVKQSSRLRRLQ